MKALAAGIAAITRKHEEYGHPIDHNVALEPAYLKAAEEVSREQALSEPIPKLCTLVTASPFDAAVHDAFGKLHKRSVYHTYGPDLMTHDLAHYLTPDFKGEYLSKYVLPRPKPRMPLYHLVGAVDPIVDADIKQRINDGLPETLPEWIRYNGLTHIKIKLNGEDTKWDTEPRSGRGPRRRRNTKGEKYRHVVLLARLQREVPQRRPTCSISSGR